MSMTSRIISEHWWSRSSVKTGKYSHVLHCSSWCCRHLRFSLTSTGSWRRWLGILTGTATRSLRHGGRGQWSVQVVKFCLIIGGVGFSDAWCSQNWCEVGGSGSDTTAVTWTWPQPFLLSRTNLPLTSQYITPAPAKQYTDRVSVTSNKMLHLVENWNQSKCQTVIQRTFMSP